MKSIFPRNILDSLNQKRNKVNLKNKRQMKIAIPTNDGENIFQKMLGRAKEFHIYEINEKKFRFIEKRNNPYESTLQHLKTLDVYELISDCDIIISSRIGKKGIKRLKERGLKLFFRNGKIKDELRNLIVTENFWKM